MKRRVLLNFNYIIADLVSRLNIGLLRKLRFIRVMKTTLVLRILRLLYQHGIIRTFRIETSYIAVYFKFANGQPIGKFSLISRPGRRCYWNLSNLTTKFNKFNFSGFFIISSQYGLVTSNYSLLSGHMGGEVLIKVEI